MNVMSGSVTRKQLDYIVKLADERQNSPQAQELMESALALHGVKQLTELKADEVIDTLEQIKRDRLQQEVPEGFMLDSGIYYLGPAKNDEMYVVDWDEDGEYVYVYKCQRLTRDQRAEVFKRLMDEYE